jgi:hypothetical protein
MSTETRKREGNKDLRLKEAAISEKQEDIWENLQEDLQTGECEANRQIFCSVRKNQGLDLVERLTTFETVEEPTRIVGVREAIDVGALATLDSFVPIVRMETDRKRFMFGQLD